MWVYPEREEDELYGRKGSVTTETEVGDLNQKQMKTVYTKAGKGKNDSPLRPLSECVQANV